MCLRSNPRIEASLKSLALAVFTICASAACALAADTPAPLRLHASHFLDVANASGETGKTGSAFPLIQRLLGIDSAGATLTAFEENRSFVYAAAKIGGHASGPVWSRRILFFKPSVFVVDDEIVSRGSARPPRWRFYYSPFRAEVRGSKAQFRGGGRTILLETLLPQKVNHAASRKAQTVAEHDAFIELTSLTSGRFLHVIQLPSGAGQGAKSQLVKIDSRMQLTVTTAKRLFRWHIPAQGGGPGEIEIMDGAAKPLLGMRPLPSGIMPHTPEGIRLLEIWDADYRDGRHPRWDTGQPSADLRKAIEDGTIAPGRTVEFGCGTGTDAIYMASRGFDVTAIDISPSAIAQAIAKARKAGVAVRFMLADALNPPDIGTFDFIFDRACYHEVRGQNLEAYIQTLRKASRPGTRLLLLAGNSNGPDLGFGPPTVSEEELRYDFLPFFDIEWLRESRFEVNPPSAGFPLAWSVLMRRKTEK